MFEKEKRVTVVQVEEKASAVRGTKLVREGPASGRGDFARDVILITFEDENQEQFVITSSEEMAKGLRPGAKGIAVYRNNRLLEFKCD